jgi:hypothetical protein
MARQDMEQRVRRVAEQVLTQQRFVSAIDVLLGLGWLTPPHLDMWRQGRVDSLERVVQANLRKITVAMAEFRRWARDRGLNPSETVYVARTRDRRRLRFSVSGDDAIELAYRTHWVAPDLSRRTVERQSRPPDLAVIWPVNEWTCTSCGGTGDLLFHGGPGPAVSGLCRSGPSRLSAIRRCRADQARKASQPPFGGGGPVESVTQAV